MKRIDLKSLNFYLVTCEKPKYAKRREIVLSRLKKYNITPTIMFGEENNNLGGWFGFFKAINNEIRREEFTPFVILEDDVEFFAENPNFEVEFPESADALWLGNSMSMLRYRRFNENISQIFGMGGTHSILFLSRSFCLSFRQGLELAKKFNTYYDITTKIYQEIYEVYTLNEPIFYQDRKLEGQEKETRFILSGNRITEDEYNNWKLYRRIGMDPVASFVDARPISYKLV